MVVWLNGGVCHTHPRCVTRAYSAPSPSLAPRWDYPSVGGVGKRKEWVVAAINAPFVSVDPDGRGRGGADGCGQASKSNALGRENAQRRHCVCSVGRVCSRVSRSLLFQLWRAKVQPVSPWDELPRCPPAHCEVHRRKLLPWRVPVVCGGRYRRRAPAAEPPGAT